MTRPSRTALLVVGMHRSGTSALTGVICHMGADLPNDLMAGSDLNAKGFFESNRITQFDEDLLASAGFTWWDCRRFPAAWFASPKAGEFALRAADELAAEYGGSALFVLKDPRICRLAPFWLPVLKDNGCRPLVVHTHRHPGDVAASLEHRAGYDLDYGLLMWLRHVLDAEAETRGERRVFTSYEHLMQDWSAEVDRIGEGLGLSWPRTLSMVAPVVDDFLSRDLQHFNRTSGARAATATLPPLVRKTYEIVEAWAAGGERAADHARLDKLRDRLDAATESFGGLARRGQEWRYEARQYREAHHELAGNHARQQAELAAATQQIGQAEAELQRLRGAAEVAAQAAQAVQAERDALELARREEQVRFAAEQGRSGAELADTGQRLAAVTAELDLARATAEAAAKDRARLQADLAAAARHLEDLTAELAAARAGLSDMADLEAALHQARSTAIQRDEETDQLRRRLDAVEARSQELEAALVRARDAQDAAEHERARVARQLARLTAHMTTTMERDLVGRLARIEAAAVASQALPKPDAGIAADASVHADDGRSPRVVAGLAEVPPPEPAEDQSVPSQPRAAIAGIEIEPDDAGNEAPSQAVAGLAGVPLSEPAAILSPASDPESLSVASPAPSPGETKWKRPHDGVKPPFRGLKRLWRKARGRGVPRR